ncbi:MAG: hypothetical protein A3J40_03900 [Erythrobacter sp. RIFCSPHIGHO2_12_FULL_63_10]|nr:MAG: hypothetical protein A3J40_03900 [Erythrobacter sp. RIFCSPHIGHO2_12_FULL_63_10]
MCGCNFADETIYTRIYASLIVTFPKVRQDGILNYCRRFLILHQFLKAKADFNSNFAFARCDDQQETVIAPRISDSPSVAKVARIVCDIGPFEIRRCGYNELHQCFLFQRRQLLCQHCLETRFEEVSGVHNAPRQFQSSSGWSGLCVCLTSVEQK